MKSRKDGPTKRIITMAWDAPGQLIRWREAEAVYDSWNKYRKFDNNRNNLRRIFDRHFVKVEGVRGYYVLKESIRNDSVEDDQEASDQYTTDGVISSRPYFETFRRMSQIVVGK